MPVECPNCRQSIPRIRLFVTPAWGRWRCGSCGSLLGIDVRRRLLATIPWVGILFFLIFVVRITSLGLVIAVPMIIAAGILNFFLFDRAVVRDRTGFRCRECGYDLQGQVEARCPECGAEFDLAELAAHQADGSEYRPVASWSKFRLALTIVVGVAVLLLTVGVMYLRSARVQTARQQAIATQQTARAATQPVAAGGFPADWPTTAPASRDDAVPANQPATP